MFIFFFKQKTAYEMRISDWSSDVCSSDLSARPDVSQRSRFRIAAIFDLTFKSQAAAQSGHSRRTQGDVRRRAESGAVFARFVGMAAKRGKGVGPPFQQEIGSATSELQSLMRISYAVFCLKKQTTRTQCKRYQMQHHNLQRITLPQLVGK